MAAARKWGWVPGHLTASVLMYVEASSKIEAEWSELGSANRACTALTVLQDILFIRCSTSR